METEAIDKFITDLDLKKGTELFGSNGLVKLITKRLVERVLEAELEEHLGYPKGERGEEPRANPRNGTSPKRVKTDDGEIELQVPRDRNGTFEPQLVKKRQTRLDGFDDKVLSLYGRGMSTREIQGHLAELYGTEVSPDLISRVTDVVLEDIQTWRKRPLAAVWPIVYLDALVVRIRDGGTVRRKSVYLAIGVGLEGRKEVLGMWLEETEGARFWLKVITELKNRGVEDILIACVDGLKGFPEALESVFPMTTVQTCIVHMIRNSTRLISWKDRKQVARDLKPIYTAVDRDAAESALADFDKAWGKQYPAVTQSWRSSWERVVPFLDFPPDLRRILYTTNAIESFNARVRKLVNGKGHFPTDDAAFKLIYLAVVAAEKRWTRPPKGWSRALNQLAIHFEGRLPL
ncbi:IS256 family transposase [Paraliomyxa miuraensis]|uniref:IS256 family transposase n=1 Tax=Paraliomyxa miuraensis TaxID=376150 RepID=UPI002250A721|nr:IS256 family transposase [Paraliomyxa miuraensis]MCX4241865.1 IS256 family transposase [Paraliomyxa miuraensis]